ncbi:hypothetical protein [Planktothrix pseudagardhii]|uniref:Uncharacterized protein n=1 Tax=Planktothrix pseudagardhii TaxID=132604 RepID=A0A9W4CVA3_9CYAN|nr:hypothetical protein [Planktothrix pseudagardhii]CAD5972255.1 hypothetical protein NO713_03902 [Planktothrix pseudagardhii]
MNGRLVIVTFSTLITLFAGFAVILWDKVLQWAIDSLLPWVDQEIPTLAPIVRIAFTVVDKVGSPAYSKIKQSWQEVRQYLLKQVMQFEQESSDTWVRRVTSWLIPVLHSSDSFPKVKQRSETVEVDFYNLPDDVREAFLRREEKMTEWDITKIQDDKLEKDDLTYEN